MPDCLRGVAFPLKLALCARVSHAPPLIGLIHGSEKPWSASISDLLRQLSTAFLAEAFWHYIRWQAPSGSVCRAPIVGPDLSAQHLQPLGCSTAFRPRPNAIMDPDIGYSSFPKDDSFCTIYKCNPPSAHGPKPFPAIKKLLVSTRVVARFAGGFLLSLKSHTAPRSTVRHAPTVKDNINSVYSLISQWPPPVLHSMEEEHAARGRSSRAPWPICRHHRVHLRRRPVGTRSSYLTPSRV